MNIPCERKEIAIDIGCLRRVGKTRYDVLVQTSTVAAVEVESGKIIQENDHYLE